MYIEICGKQQIYTGVSDSKKIDIRRYYFAGKCGIYFRSCPSRHFLQVFPDEKSMGNRISIF